MKGTILQMYLKSLRALIFAEASEVDMLLFGIPFDELRITFEDVIVSPSEVVPVIRFSQFSAALFPGFHRRMVSVVLR
jgi:hypothetical protein